jgi:hypothetical protein
MRGLAAGPSGFAGAQSVGAQTVSQGGHRRDRQPSEAFDPSRWLNLRMRCLANDSANGTREPVAIGGLHGTSIREAGPVLLVLMTRLIHLDRDLVTS